MSMQGDLRKLRSALADPVRYALRLAPAPGQDADPGSCTGSEAVDLTAQVGRPVQIDFLGAIHCVRCGQSIRKTYGDGFCYPCFRDAPEAAPCIVRPERCEAHLGRGRDPAFEARYHNRPHVVYLALTSALKVGVTRADQVETRWIDQGAWRVVRLCETPYRQLAGAIEVACKAHVGDRTPWQRMLRDERAAGVDLHAEKRRLLRLLPPDLARYASPDDAILEIHYPVIAPPARVRSVRLERHGGIAGRLTGIRGQYLIFEGGRVLNVRRHLGYGVRVVLG